MIIHTGIFMLTAAGISVLIWVVICILTIHYKARQAERHDTKFTPKGTIIGFVVTGLIGQVIYWAAAWLILQGAASAAVAMMEYNAQTVYNTAVEYAKHHDGEIRSVSGTSLNRGDYAYDSLEAEIIHSFPYEMKPFWFKVTADDKGNVTAAYFARHEIGRNDIRSVNSELQMKMVLNPYMGEDSITGSWTIADERQSARIRGGMTDAAGDD